MHDVTPISAGACVHAVVDFLQDCCVSAISHGVRNSSRHLLANPVPFLEIHAEFTRLKLEGRDVEWQMIASWAWQIARHPNPPTLLIVRRCSPVAAAVAIVCAEAGLVRDDVLLGHITDAEFHRLKQEVVAMARSSLWFMDARHLEPFEPRVAEFAELPVFRQIAIDTALSASTRSQLATLSRQRRVRALCPAEA